MGVMDMQSKTQRVFMAGNGAVPPALTGRANEQAVLSRCLGDLRGNAAPPHDVVLVGPRGNGKTVLLRWFQHACAQSKPAVDVAWLTPSALPNQPALLNALAPRRWLAKLLPRKIGIASVGSAEWTPNHGGGDLTAALISRCRRRPLAVVLDEAHTLDLHVGSALLNASQQVRAEAPFLLVLAGTPGLPAHLDSMNVSFWSRLGEGELGIGCLSEKAAEQALTEPLDAHRVEIDADALAYVVTQSQCYPYFIQLWGDALWQRLLAEGATTVVAEHAKAVQPAVAVRVANYYQRRFAELESEGLLAAAAAIARLFVDPNDATASDQDVDAALAEAGFEGASERYAQREGLNRLGYIWRPPNQQAPFRWHTGIPSLMTYVLEQAAA